MRLDKARCEMYQFGGFVSLCVCLITDMNINASVLSRLAGNFPNGATWVEGG